MIRFRTEVNIPKSPNEITHEDHIVLIGSCFSDNIGVKLENSKFRVLRNPFGVLYNPLSVAGGLDILMEKKIFNDSDILRHNGMWHSFYHHSIFSHPEKSECLKKINDSIKKGHDCLKMASHVFITFGTSWVFENISSGKVVSNCHKIPSNEFRRYSPSLNRIVSEFGVIVERMKSFNPDVRIVFTVSPIRHWKDGAVENQRSKSALIMAVWELTKKYPWTEYFPSYEIMMDDLRDYRFYAEDMIHPNDMAIQYIWDKFILTYLSPERKKILDEINKLVKAANHRPFQISSTDHQKFVHRTLEKMKDIERQHPSLDFTTEKSLLNKQLR